MTRKFHMLSLAAMVTMAGAMGATAATIDFTDDGTYAINPLGASGTTDSIGWELDSNPNLTFLTVDQDYDGVNDPATHLALDNDGVGVVAIPNGPDDEVTFPRESLTLSFDPADGDVGVTGFYFLDLFGDETVTIYDENNVQLAVVTATSAAGDNSYGGYTYFAFDATVTSLTFVPGANNDFAGKPDFALAAVDLAAVPVPAAGLLLVTALGGLGLAKRRRKMAA